ncbi:MAG: hypothetical protein ACLUOI_09860 [Eisenbergiella sp.]
MRLCLLVPILCDVLKQAGSEMDETAGQVNGVADETEKAESYP